MLEFAEDESEFIQDVMVEFFAESEELLQRLDLDIVELEEANNPELVDSAFRSLHTIKGSAGFLGLQAIEQAAHDGETLLSKVRSGLMPVTADTITHTLSCVDAIREGLRRAREEDSAGREKAPTVTARPGEDTPNPSERKNPSAVEQQESAPANKRDAQPEAPKARKEATSTDSENIRVDVAVLDNLMDTVGELIIARNRLGAAVSAGEDIDLSRLSVLLNEVRDTVMAARTQPMSVLLTKFPRAARDTAQALGKKVRVDISGGDVEIDRAVADVLRDPLGHILRNSIDHGIEKPDERARVGKNPTGTISVNARVEGGMVYVTIEDDGRGIDEAAVRVKAQQMGLPAGDDVPLHKLLFTPGLTTKGEVSLVSGRGVGLDAVSTTIADAGGVVHVENSPGQGAVVVVAVPLNLVVVPTLTFDVGGQRFAIAQSSVDEMCTITQGMVVSLPGGNALDLRGELIDLISPPSLLGIAATCGRHAVVVDHRGWRYAFEVDDIVGTEELVVKPLDPIITQDGPWSGAAIFPDGRPHLVVDPVALGTLAQLSPRGEQEQHLEPDTSSEEGPSRRLVLRTTSQGKDIAVSASDIERIREVGRDDIQEMVGGLALRDGDRVLPLMGTLHSHSQASGRVLIVVVHQEGGRVGFIVDEVDDLAKADILASESPQGDSTWVAAFGNTLVDLLQTRAGHAAKEEKVS